MNHDEKERGDQPQEKPGRIRVVNPRFPLGSLAIGRYAQQSLTLADVQTALQRHASADWGDLGDDEKLENDWALKKGRRLLSKYHAANGNRFFITTEGDRSMTTVCLPEEY